MAPPNSWMMEQRFSMPPGNYGASKDLLKLQSFPPEVKCHIFCQDKQLLSGDDVSVFFHMDPSPLQSSFKVELRLMPQPQGANTTQEVRDKYREERMWAVFTTYDDQDSTAGLAYHRTPHTFNGATGQNTMPSGPINFSRRLYDVRYSSYVHSPLRGKVKPWPGVQEQDQMWFSWRSQFVVRMATSRPTGHLSSAAAAAAQTFNQILDLVASDNRPQLMILTRADPKFRWVYPWFASLPYPTPPSYWPWLRRRIVGRDPDPGEEIMDFSGHNFELEPDYINRALAVRAEGWFLGKDKGGNPKPIESAMTVPSPLTLAKLPRILRFVDYRQYLTYVLGSHTYEYQEDAANLYRFYNGAHRCEIFPDPGGSARYIVLLKIRNPKPPVSESAGAANESSEQTLPEVGERVCMEITVDQRIGQEEWRGKVIRIPGDFVKYGRNVALEAERPSIAGGRVLSRGEYDASFYFGHHGQPVGRLRSKIIELMLGPDGILKTLLLAQDNYRLKDNDSTIGLPTDWRKKVEDVCTKHSLNEEQKDAVTHYFSHRVTIVVGPPGTGKSTLVNVILELEQFFGCRFWVCTGSNAAADVLAAKFVKSKGNTHPLHYYRLHPLFDEQLRDDSDSGNTRSPGQLAIQQAGAAAQHTVLPSDPFEAILAQLRLGDTTDRPLSLEHTIRARMSRNAAGMLLKDEKIWPTEDTDLHELRQARRALKTTRPELEGIDVGRIQEAEAKLRTAERKALRKVQRLYANNARGIFSTDAAASGPLLQHYAPMAFIMDEASQIDEARAGHAIGHAVAAKRVRRILIIGDHDQLPPTIKAARNPCSSSGEMSMMERLILAGTPYIQLKEQFRMHPTISAIINAQIYKNTLRDAVITNTRTGVSAFVTFIKKLALDCGIKQFPTTNAVVISPSKSDKFPFRSLQRNRTTSRFNPQTATMVYKLVHWILTKSSFAAKDILVTAFYADQVSLIRALFADDAAFQDVRLHTVDGAQGQEAPIQIVDSVTLGGGAGEGMGFLGGERRRFNVAMSRAMVGRIVICHKDFAKNTHSLGVWPAFIKEAKDNGWMINDRVFHGDWPTAQMRDRYADVLKSFDPSMNDKIGHKNVTANTPGNALVRAAPSNAEYNRMAFIEATGASLVAAARYLHDNGNILHVAIDRYLSEHGDGDDEDVEEI